VTQEKPAIPAETATIESVARRAGVSIATVSRVINGVGNKASAETVERVRRAIADLDYRPQSAGRSLRQKRSRLVALLAANLANPAMATIAASVETALRKAGLVMVLCDTHDRPEIQDEYLREMRAQQARALILLGAVESPLLETMRAGPTPLVFVNRRAPGHPTAPFVGIDNAAAGRDLARHCLARGLVHPAIVHGSLGSSATRERVEAIAAEFAAAGHPIAPERRLCPERREHLELGFEAARLLDADAIACDVVICASDLIAFGVRRHWRERGGDAAMPAIVGFDDSPLNDWVAPWLTSVRIPYEAFGPAIVDLLGDLFGEAPPRAGTRVLPHLLIERPSDLVG
jgi:LacI family transcriptional regulator